MDIAALAAGFLISTGRPPLDTALTRTEPPPSLRAAFTVELTDGNAFREIRFDPRLQEEEARWTLVETRGESGELDRVVTEWGDEISPDGWLIPDDLRASMGGVVEAEDLGRLWKIEFEHQPSENDGPVDIWASEHLVGYAWLEPVNQHMIRVEYVAPDAFNAPTMGRIESYEHQYVLHQDPRYGVSYISAFMIEFAGTVLNEDVTRSYRARITDIDFFFSSRSEEALFWSRQRGVSPSYVGILAQH